jgi:hypothetical protein
LGFDCYWIRARKARIEIEIKRHSTNGNNQPHPQQAPTKSNRFGK